MIQEIREKLTIVETGKNIREIVSADTKLRLARLVNIDDQTVLIVDAVEKASPRHCNHKLSIKDRELLYEEVEAPDLGTPNINVSKLVLAYYKNPNRTELVSIRVYINGNVSNKEAIELFLKVLEKYAPSYFERLRKILNKYVKTSTTEQCTR